MGADDREGEKVAQFSAGDTVAGRYRVARLIGRGGMGDVYAADHLLTGQQVALKVMRRSSDEAKRRLLREAKAASRLRSEHTARVLDADTLPSGDPFLVLELLEGQDLASVLRARGRLSVADAVAYVAEAAEALAEAHALGIVHRDVKPANLFLLAQSERVNVKVLDFGIAKIDAGSDTSVTITGSVMGSPRYMSPEQIRDPKRIDARTDVWSLGVTLHELLTGHAPFEGNYAPALCAMITSEAPRLRLATTPGVPSELTKIVERCLAKDRRERFASAAELEIELRGIIIGEGSDPVSSRPRPARTASDDTLEPQDTSSRGGPRASTAPPSKLASRRRNAALAVGLATAFGVAVWWTSLQSKASDPTAASGGAVVNSPTATAAGVLAAEPASSVLLSSGGSAAPEPPLSQQTATAVASQSASASVRAPAVPLADRRIGGAASAVTATSGSPAKLDEAAVLKDRR